MWSSLLAELGAFPARLTLKICLACLALHVVLGVPLAWWLSGRRTFCRRAASFLVTLPLVFPPVALGFILLMALGRRSPLGEALESAFGLRMVFSFPGLVLAAFIAGLPLLVRPLEAALRREEIAFLARAARTLGCGPVKAFLLVSLPQAGNSLASGLLLGLARASGEVGISMMLGGNIIGRSNTLSLEIYNSVSYGDFDRAMVLCVILAVCGLGLYAILERLAPKDLL